jgi:class 3 adenylate cyclase/DNA-binding transcriptional ArsR family regulator
MLVTRLLGRASEMTVLDGEKQRSVAGEFRCVLVSGDPGVGKTRLVSEFLARQDKATPTLLARAYPFSSTASFGLWGEALDRYLRSFGTEEVSRLCGGYLDDLAGLVRSVARARGSAPDGEPSRIRLLEGLAALLESLEREAPLVLFLDDVHLADASSWEALAYLARNLSDSRILVIAAARLGELADQHAANEVLFGLEQEALLTKLILRPLERDALSKLAEEAIGSEPAEALVGWLADRTRGNPLFAVELIQALLDEGVDLSHPELRSLPGGLAERVSGRLKLLDEAAMEILELLAALGRPAELGDLIRLSGKPLDTVGEILRPLVRSRLITEEKRGRDVAYEIEQPLVRETVYESMGGARQRVLHRVIGRALLDSGHLGEAAPHFARSAEVGDPEAIEALRDAVRQAEAKQAYREALTILGALVEIVPHGDPRWLEVLDALSWQAEWVYRGGVDSAVIGIRAMQEIDSALEGSSDPGRRAAVKFRLANFYTWGTGELDEAVRACSEAEALFEQAGDFSRKLLAADELAYVQGHRGDLDTWETGARRVVQAAEAAGDRYVTMQAMGSLGFATFFRGRFPEADVAFRRGVEMAKESGKLPRLTLSRTALAFSLAFQGRMAEALPLLEEIKAEDPAWRANLLLKWEPAIPWLAGSFAASLASGQEIMARFPGGLSRREAWGVAFAALSAVETDQLVEARKYLLKAHAAYDNRGWLMFSDWAPYAEAVLAWREGKTDEALRGLRQVGTRIFEMGAWPFAAFLLLDLAELAAECKATSLAEEAAAQLERCSVETDCDLYRGLAAMGTGWSDFAAGATPGAIRSAEAAVHLLSGTGCRAFEGRAFELLGHSLAEEDPDQAVEALERAVTIFESCGAVWRRGRAIEALRDLCPEPDRVLATVVFTDIVESTQKATELGDHGWRELLETHQAVVRKALDRFGGHEVKTMGDGFLVTFDGPARAIRFARAVIPSVRHLGIQLRVGIHTGECEIMGDDLGGIAVHVAARVAKDADPDAVLVTSTVKDLVAGSGISFADRGEHTLKGVPDQWHLYAVEGEESSYQPRQR